MTPKQRKQASKEISKRPTISVDDLRAFFARNDAVTPTREELLAYMDQRRGWAWRQAMEGVASAWEKLGV